jgi:hypothetical protein
MYSTAIYSTPEIRARVEALLAPLQSGHVDLANWDHFVSELQNHHGELATLFRETYLKTIL